MNHHLTISCKKDNLSVIRQFIADSLEIYNISEIEKHKLILAIDEVCANLIIHANECNSNESLDVDLDVEPEDKITFKRSFTYGVCT